MRVVTFNIQHGRAAGGHVDLDLLGSTCAALHADVLALQEVGVGGRRTGGADLAAAVAAATGMAHVFGEAIPMRGGGVFGNALLARGSLGDVEVRRLPPRPAPWWRSRRPAHRAPQARVAVIATATVRGEELTAATAHLGLWGPEATAQLADLAAALAARPAPRVLLGDLNLGPDPVRRVVARAGMVLVEGPPTFPARRPVRRIDHVAVDGFTAVGADAPAVPVSDHRPLVVDLAPADPDRRAGGDRPA